MRASEDSISDTLADEPHARPMFALRASPSRAWFRASNRAAALAKLVCDKSVRTSKPIVTGRLEPPLLLLLLGGLALLFSK